MANLNITDGWEELTFVSAITSPSFRSLTISQQLTQLALRFSRDFGLLRAAVRELAARGSKIPTYTETIILNILVIIYSPSRRNKSVYCYFRYYMFFFIILLWALMFLVDVYTLPGLTRSVHPFPKQPNVTQFWMINKL